MSTLQAIKFDRENRTLLVLDQLLIPFQEQYIPVHSVADGYSVIRKMQVRGAPAIAIVGALSIVVELNYILNGGTTQAFYDIQDLLSFKKTLLQRINFLVTSRPTAVNLSNAARDIASIIEQANTSVPALYQAIYDYTIKLFDDDLTNNYKIGSNGADFILNDLQSQDYKGGFSVITICNTGSLATSGHGTALGVIRTLWQRSKENRQAKKTKTDRSVPLYSDAWLDHVFPLETRPYNQGSRLTAFELEYEKIPATLITDSMVSYLIDLIHKRKLKDYSPVKYIIVGADRIVSNGDTANKIGTYQLATLASAHPEIKFLVAAPKTTIDLSKATGDDIFVEERPANELKTVTGGLVTGGLVGDGDGDGDSGKVVIGKVRVAPESIAVWNPSFDVTDHALIDGIMTEERVLVKNDGEFRLD